MKNISDLQSPTRNKYYEQMQKDNLVIEEISDNSNSISSEDM